VSKAGVNGVAVQKLGGKYLLFAVTGYDLDSVRCYDVTDPSNISLFDGFGESGVMAWATAGGKEDPSYIAVDPDGVVYVSSEKDNAVYKISKDGKKSLGKASVTKAFGLCEYGDYIDEAAEAMFSTLTGIGTGDEELTKTQEDHGQATFYYNFITEEMVWQKADGTNVIFTQAADQK
jgi:DNA-binding beta-propeller fold protein YncE